MLVPDSQKLLRCELESLRTQLQAQTKVGPSTSSAPVLILLPTPGPYLSLLPPQAFEFLNHSVTMLEKESCLQQIKIQQLEGEDQMETKVRTGSGEAGVNAGLTPTSGSSPFGACWASVGPAPA